MKQIERKVDVHDYGAVSTVWRIPDDFDGERAVILAHGAGNDMNSEFISAMHERWADAGVMAVKFNFLYKERGGKLPDRQKVLMDTWRAVAHAVKTDSDPAPKRLFYAGKSLGGRIASMLVAGEGGASGLIFLGYPLHPAGKPDKLRIDHLGSVRCPMLFIQGTRDALCDLGILDTVLKGLAGAENELHVIEGGDHSFNLLKRMKRDPAEVRDEILNRTLEFMNTHDR